MNIVLLVAAVVMANAEMSPKPDIVTCIEQGKKLVDPLPVAKNQIHLAVLNPQGKIAVASIRVDPRYKGPGSASSYSPKGYTFEWDKLNGVNTHFRVTQPAGSIVVALKRKLMRSPGTATYVPYSDGINVPELRDAGLRYLEDTILEAERQLRNRRVFSKRDSTEAVPDRFPTELTLTLALIEHIDPDRTMSEPIGKLLDEVLVVIGANKGMAYRYAVSPKANARGLFQFISKTYKAIRKRYPAAKLKPDFVSGMNDHLNGAIASYLLFDNDLKAMSVAKSGLVDDPFELGRLLAASYNGGPSRVISAIDENGELRIQYLKPETRIYVKKYEQVWPLVSKEAEPSEDILEEALLPVEVPSAEVQIETSAAAVTSPEK